MTRYVPGTPVIVTSSLFRGFYGVVDSWQEKKQRYIVAIDGGARLSLLADSIAPIPQPSTTETDRKAKPTDAELAAALMMLVLLAVAVDKPAKNN